MNKNVLFLLALAIPLLTMGAGCAKQVANNQTSPTTVATTTTTVATTTDEGGISAVIEPGVTVVKTKTGNSTSATKSYIAALGIYEKSGYRFQFSNCSGNPGSLDIKLGTKFMIDNRDNESHEIVIDTKKYQLAAYDFAIVSVQKAGSVNITCDGGGAAHVQVEK